jgi:tRNA pseudouridine55 synthase
MNTMDGILLVDKPSGWTSFDVVAKIRGLAKKQTGQKVKVGHTGTLDPAATGLLIIVLGSYCKRAEEFSKLDKTYEAEMVLGKVSTTGDIEGEITQKSDIKPAQDEIEAVLNQFNGEIMQTPHKFSAMKVNGQRAYDLARSGKDVQLEPRKVNIYTLELINYSYPTLKLTTEVSSGSYIRSLAEDIGENLGTGAYLSSLRRLTIGDYNIKDAITIDELEKNDIIENIRQTLSL